MALSHPWKPSIKESGLVYMRAYRYAFFNTPDFVQIPALIRKSRADSSDSQTCSLRCLRLSTCSASSFPDMSTSHPYTFSLLYTQHCYISAHDSQPLLLSIRRIGGMVKDPNGTRRLVLPFPCVDWGVRFILCAHSSGKHALGRNVLCRPGMIPGLLMPEVAGNPIERPGILPGLQQDFDGIFFVM